MTCFMSHTVLDETRVLRGDFEKLNCFDMKSLIFFLCPNFRTNWFDNKLFSIQLPNKSFWNGNAIILKQTNHFSASNSHRVKFIENKTKTLVSNFKFDNFLRLVGLDLNFFRLVKQKSPSIHWKCSKSPRYFSFKLKLSKNSQKSSNHRNSHLFNIFRRPRISQSINDELYYSIYTLGCHVDN